MNRQASLAHGARVCDSAGGGASGKGWGERGYDGLVWESESESARVRRAVRCVPVPRDWAVR